MHLQAQQRLQEEGCVVDISGLAEKLLYLTLFVSCFITSLVYKRKVQKKGVKFVSYASSF